MEGEDTNYSYTGGKPKKVGKLRLGGKTTPKKKMGKKGGNKRGR